MELAARASACVAPRHARKEPRCVLLTRAALLIQPRGLWTLDWCSSSFLGRS